MLISEPGSERLYSLFLAGLWRDFKHRMSLSEGKINRMNSKEQIEAADESFWQTPGMQLKEPLGAILLYLYPGVCNVLMGITGRFSVVIHGERDCANSFHLFHKRTEHGDVDFYSTDLNEGQFHQG